MATVKPKKKRLERTEREMSIADAVSEAFGDFSGLGEEMRSWADSMEEKLSHTEKYDRVNTTADTLENFSEPEHPDWANNTKIKIMDLPRRKRPYSRADRNGQACYILDTAIEACENRLEELGNGDNAKAEADAVESYRDDLQNVKDEAEGVDFPGMYG